jgi:hypothetical protein
VVSIYEYDASGTAGFPPDATLPLQGLQVVKNGNIARHSQILSYFSKCRRVSVPVNVAADKVENLLLPGSEIFHFITNIIPIDTLYRLV